MNTLESLTNQIDQGEFSEHNVHLITELMKGYKRYEKVRRLHPFGFDRIWTETTANGIPFDQLVDEL